MYSNINFLLSTTHQNFSQTKTMVETLLMVNEQMSRAQKLLDEDVKKVIG
jgi:hypothetical protein